MDVSVKFRGLSGHSPTSSQVQEAEALVQQVGLCLRPVHPGIDDAELSTYYVVAGSPDRASAESLAAALFQLPEIEGAYVSPDAQASAADDAPPSG